MSEDLKLKDSVLEELDWDPRVDAAHIGVEVHGGAVTLTGHVEAYPQKEAAVDGVKRVTGVRTIVDHIEVRLPEAQSASDEDIAEKIAHIIDWSVTVPSRTVQAEVKNGDVTLTGEVDWRYQRDGVERQVRDVRGVRGIFNLVKVRKTPTKEDVKKRIRSTLERHAQFEASKVEVEVVGHQVTLSGTVDSLDEIERIENAAWSTAGVSSVIDNLRVA